MPTKVDLLVSNLQESVKSLQRFMLTGLGAALFFVLLAFSSEKQVTLQAPSIGSTVPVSLELALLLSLSIYWVSGIVATLLVARARRLVLLLRKEAAELVEPTLLYPSFVTLRAYGPRLGLALLPVVFVVVGSVHHWSGQLFALWPAFGLFVLAVPYPCLAYELRTTIDGHAPSTLGD